MPQAGLSTATSSQRLPSSHDDVHVRRGRPSQSVGSKIILVEFQEEANTQDVSSESEPEPTPAKKRQRGSKKSQGACAHCKSLKVRCQFTAGESRCQRCIAGGHQCVARLRKKRKEAPSHDGLRERSRQQDIQIQSLLDQFDRLFVDAQTNRWIQQARQLDKLGITESCARPVGPVTCHYYSSLIGPLDVDLSPTSAHYPKIPLILRTGILDCEEVIVLFNLYFERINPFFSLLDGELHCPQRLIWKSPLLFTVICACAARHYNRHGLWSLANDIARAAAAEALISGPQDVETVQALLILAVYPVPKKKWLEDKSWLFMGAAIRMAHEIGLNVPPTDTDIRENLNRVRTWMNVFCVDVSHATQFGKMPMVRLDYIVRKLARNWYTTLDSSPYDIGLCAYAEALLLMMKYRHGLGPPDLLAHRFKEGFDVASHCIQYDKDFIALAELWQTRLDADPNVQLCPVVRYRCNNFRMVAAYMRLVILSVGFQYSLKTGLSRDDYILQQSIAAAQRNLEIVIDILFPSGLLSWAMDANFLYMTFCAGFLLNLLRPKLLPLLTPSQCRKIVDLVKRLINILGSDEVALDGRHAPAIYAKFLSNMFTKYYTPSLQDDGGSVDIFPQYPADRELTPLNAFIWPDIPSGEVVPMPEFDQPVPHATYIAREQAGEAEMDFSVSHFVQSTIAPMTNPIPAQAPQPLSFAFEELIDPLDDFNQWQQPFDYAAIFGLAGYMDQHGNQ